MFIKKKILVLLIEFSLFFINFFSYSLHLEIVFLTIIHSRYCTVNIS